MSVTVNRTTKTHDRTTDTFTVSASSITGEMVKVRGNPERYRDLGLVESEAPSFIFTPTTYGDSIAIGDTFSFASVTYTIREVRHIAPDGVTIATKLIAER